MTAADWPAAVRWLACQPGLLGWNELFAAVRDVRAACQMTSWCGFTGGGVSWSTASGGKVSYRHPDHGVGTVPLRDVAACLAAAVTVDQRHRLDELTAARGRSLHGEFTGRLHYPQGEDEHARADRDRAVTRRRDVERDLDRLLTEIHQRVREPDVDQQGPVQLDLFPAA